MILLGRVRAGLADRLVLYVGGCVLGEEGRPLLGGPGPTTIAEAALIDGCSHSKLFFRVMLPMAKPGLISVGIFNFLGHWNQFLLPQTLMQRQTSFDPDRSVLAQGLVALAIQQGYRSDLSGLFAGMTIAMLPILVVYLVFQRQVQSGLTGATLK